MDVSKFLLNILSLSIHYKLSVTSWIRSVARNTRVGGAPTSRHLIGHAVDIVLDEGQNEEQFQKDAKRLGLIVIKEKDHYHVQTD